MKKINLTTLKKLQNFYMSGEDLNIFHEMYAAEIGIRSKRFDVEVVKKDAEILYKRLNFPKIKYLGDVDGMKHYLIISGTYQCDFFGKKDIKKAYFGLKNKAKKIRKFIKKYL